MRLGGRRLPPPALAAKMKADWDRRAEENARCYIASHEWQSEEVFRASGERDAALIVRGLDDFLRPHMRVLEVGCGIGRLLRVLAPRFAELHGVDVSGEMIRRGRAWLADCPNVVLHENSGVDLELFPDARFDFVFSYITFQHVPRPVVGAYCTEVRRVLAPGGRFRFQVLNFERVDGETVEPPLEDTFALRSTSVPEVEAMVGRVGMEVVARYEIHAPDRVMPGHRRIRQIWLTCQHRVPGGGGGAAAALSSKWIASRRVEARA
ncbi:MAG TPA: class I SAM-dependent methyltransferase [Methylomirabilota bacterium]|nr:class I SAM-dependent methyltransferase [Methylomirabilota bacterium]